MAKKKKFKAPAPVAWSNEPIMTTAQLAEYYDCEPRQIKQNFNNNAERFEEGKHYFKLEGELLKMFKASLVENFDLPVNKFAPTLYLWTRRGAARHAKMLTTEKAWEVYEKLEEFYFDHEKFQYNQARENSKESNKSFKEVIKEFAAYAKAQGTSRPELVFFAYYSRLCNKLAGLPNKRGRDNATLQQLVICAWIEDRMKKFFIGGMEKNLPYKEIERRVKSWAERFLAITQESLAIDTATF